MGGWAASGGAKIERAKEHVTEFDRASREFLDTHPYIAVAEFKAERREIRFVVQEIRPIPPRLATITADAIHNLRVSLDILWHHVWSKGKPGRRKLYFPILKDAHELQTRFKSVKEPTHKAAVNLLQVAKAHKAGNNLLGALTEIDDRDKHEVPVLAAASYRRIEVQLPPDMSLFGQRGARFAGKATTGYFFLEHGAELPIALVVKDGAPPPSIVNVKCDLTADIAFGKGQILEGQPVLKTLHELAQLVDGIANAFLTAGLIS
jgi:hypothetical protein